MDREFDTEKTKKSHSKQDEVNAFFGLKYKDDPKFRKAQNNGPVPKNSDVSAVSSKATPSAKSTPKSKPKPKSAPAVKKAAAAKKKK